MKKVYEKPQVYMERFELAEHIAGCSLDITGSSEISCTGNETINGEVIPNLFIDGNSACATVIEGYCYTASSINVALINS